MRAVRIENLPGANQRRQPMPRTALDIQPTTNSKPTLYLAMELSKDSWKLAFSTGSQKVRTVAVHGGSIMGVVRAAAAAKVKLGLRSDVRVLSCYEAGRDGFWIHRALTVAGFENLVVDPSSIEVDRRERRAKTDRLDATKLVHQLVRHDERGDRMRAVHVPTPEEEDARRPGRELERLKKERSAHQARIRALLALHGINEAKLGAAFGALVSKVRGAAGQPLPPHLAAELRREADRLEVLRGQIKDLEHARAAALKVPTGRAAQMAASMMLLKGIGVNAATIYAFEFFSWRSFRNGKQVGACAGMTGTPYNSGGTSREQGISKAGNRRIRAIAIEIAWQWLRHQPQSRLSLWYAERFGNNGGRARRVGIVALARKLLVALWRYVDQGVIPDGALMKA
jgi:transposase